MNTARPCGCKGVRTCLQCEQEFNITKPSLQSELQKMEAWTYCPSCDRLYRGWDTSLVVAQHPQHEDDEGLHFPGILVEENFLSAYEGDVLMQNLDRTPWTISQSGRRKQNFGPKTNFKKRKLQNGTFQGFPKFTQFIQQRFRDVDLLHDFQTIEQCTLEYEATKGSCIDPHVDDCWIWGERVVTVNCLGNSVLTLTLLDDEVVHKYNLNLVPQYVDSLHLPLASATDLKRFKSCVIRIPMPNLSLIVMYGPARYQFEHAVLREDVKERRVCIAYREFTPMYINGDSQEKGEIVTRNAQLFEEIQKICVSI